MSSCMPSALVNLCCRALDCPHVYIVLVLNGPRVAAFPCFSVAFLFSRFNSVRTLRPKHSRKRIDFDLRITISILFGHALRAGPNGAF